MFIYSNSDDYLHDDVNQVATVSRSSSGRRRLKVLDCIKPILLHDSLAVIGKTKVDNRVSFWDVLVVFVLLLFRRKALQGLRVFQKDGLCRGQVNIELSMKSDGFHMHATILPSKLYYE